MAYVAPRGTIELYTNVPFDLNYTHTMYFASESAQRTYMTNHYYAGFTNQMYTRVKGNKVRINVKADTIYGASYIGFKNQTKWFYGFVIRISYINEQVTEVEYKIDEIQTWLFQIVWGNCFIERQHNTTDERGDNLQPEPISLDEYIAITSSSAFVNSDYVGYILSVGTVNTTSGVVSGLSSKNKFNGIASTVKYLYFSTPSALVSFLNACELENGFIKGLVTANDLYAPLTLYAVPGGCFDLAGTSVSTLVGSVTVLSESITTTKKTVDYPTEHGFGGSYEPVNKKLLTYPYTYLEIETPVKTQDYKYETFYRPSSGKPRFVMYGTCNPTPAFIIVPEQYNGLGNDFRYALTLEDFPQLQIYSSGFWGAAGGGIASVLKMAIAGLIGGTTAAIAGFKNTSTSSPSYGENMLSYDGDTITQPSEAVKYAISSEAKDVPDIKVVSGIHGGNGTTSIAPLLAYIGSAGSSGSEGFYITGVQYGLREEFAMKIDEFFSKYGYAQNKVAYPNIHARANWTYIKTKDCCIVGGGVPSDAKAVICNAMNNGITWWTGNSTVGTYTYAATGKPIANPTL